ALLLILFRVLWGIVGSSNIRMNRLVRNPLEALSHLRALVARDVPVEREHNAAGAWAVVALVLIVGTQAVTGMYIADEDEIVEGALYGSLGSDLSDLMYRVHMINANLIQIIVGLHVLMIVVYLLYAKRNLLTPMFTGTLRWPESVPLPVVDFQRWWVGLICLVISLLGVGWLADWW
ncbi:MAG: cytochrome b/b6 domain-containing protein, partial [Granulosicoccus sp.]